MTAADKADKELRAKRRAIKRQLKEKRRAEYRERKRRREAARNGETPRVQTEPSRESLRGAKFWRFCDRCECWFTSESIYATICDFCKGA